MNTADPLNAYFDSLLTSPKSGSWDDKLQQAVSPYLDTKPKDSIERGQRLCVLSSLSAGVPHFSQALYFLCALPNLLPGRLRSAVLGYCRLHIGGRYG